MTRALLLVLALGSQAASADDFCTIAQSLITDGKSDFRRIAEGKDTFEALERFKLPGANECFRTTRDDDHELGGLACIWKFSRFTEESELNARAEAMLDGFKKCYSANLTEIDSTPDHYRGRIKGSGKSADPSFGDFVSVSTRVEANDNRTITLYFDYMRFE